MSTNSILRFDPPEPLSHLDYSPVDQENTDILTQEESELAGKRANIVLVEVSLTLRLLFLNSEILQALFEVYSALAAYLSYQLESLHTSQRLVFEQNCSNLQKKEQDQGLLPFFSSVSAERAYLSNPRLRGVGSTRLALVKSNLRTFLLKISQAFQTFLGFSSEPTSSLASSSAPTTANPLLAVTVPDDLTPLDREGFETQLVIDQATELTQLKNILQDAYDLFKDVAAMKIQYKTRLDSINSQRVEEFKSTHRDLEEKNENGRQSILKFLDALEVASQELHGVVAEGEDGM
ncbi:hypothetical protein JCM5350_005723 [Sporobolomyces pararoseus]